jgi:hypothetical protein
VAHSIAHVMPSKEIGVEKKYQKIKERTVPWFLNSK